MVVEEKVEPQPIEVSQNKTYTGKMSYYRESCTGCSGITSSGFEENDLSPIIGLLGLVFTSIHGAKFKFIP